MSKTLELIDIGRFLALKLTCDGNNHEMVDMEFVKLDVATNPHTNLVGVRRNRQCQGLGIHLHRLKAERRSNNKLAPIAKAWQQGHGTYRSATGVLRMIVRAINKNIAGSMISSKYCSNDRIVKIPILKRTLTERRFH